MCSKTRTGESMHCLNCCSRAKQCSEFWPAEAQQPNKVEDPLARESNGISMVASEAAITGTTGDSAAIPIRRVANDRAQTYSASKTSLPRKDCPHSCSDGGFADEGWSAGGRG